MKYAFISTLLVLCLYHGCNSSMFDSDSCFTFGSGNVFPGGARKIDHKLQFTKAMSEYLVLLSVYQVLKNCVKNKLLLFPIFQFQNRHRSGRQPLLLTVTLHSCHYQVLKENI